MRLRTVLGLALSFGVLLALAESERQAGPTPKAFVKTAQQNTFQTSPVLPDCYTYSIDRGDPANGPSVTLSKLSAGCKVPWHTHSANAQVLFVSGTFQLEMMGQNAQTLTQGSYAYVPANHRHQESCLDTCTYFVVREGIADVHYVDRSDKEISAEVALAAVGEHPPRAE